MSRLATASSRTEQDWRALPALVPKGANKSDILESLVQGWAEPVSDFSLGGEDDDGPHGHVLSGVRFVDENFDPPKPILLEQLITKVEDRIQSQADKASGQRLYRSINLEGCDVGDFDGRVLKSTASICFRRCRFGNISFDSVDVQSSFEISSSTIYGFRCSGGTVYGDAFFDRNTVAEHFLLNATAFKSNLSMARSRVNGIVWFAGEVGGQVDVSWAVFEEIVRIDNARFRGGVLAQHTVFSGHVSARDCRFGDNSNFMFVTVNVDVELQNSSFADNCVFEEVQVPADANVSQVRFGRRSSLDGVCVASLQPPKSGFRRAMFDLSRFLANLLNWQKVRSVGELYILNRASLAALVIVPIVAGAWPLVRGTVNIYNRRLDLIEASISRVVEQKQHGIPFVLPSYAVFVDHELAVLRQQLGPLAVLSPDLSISWVLLFFGALTVSLGHFFYQVGCPKSIAKHTRDAFVAEAGRRYRESTPAQRPDLETRAIQILQDAAIRDPYSRHPQLVLRNNRVVWLPPSTDSLREFEKRYEEHQEELARIQAEAEGDPINAEPDPPGFMHSPEELKVILIDEAAASEYDMLADPRPVVAYVSATCYLIGLYCILWLITHQATSILMQNSPEYQPWPSYWRECGFALLVAWMLVGVLVAIAARTLRSKKQGAKSQSLVDDVASQKRTSA